MRKQLPLFVLLFSFSLFFGSCGQNSGKTNSTESESATTPTSTVKTEEQRQLEELEEMKRDSMIAANTDSVRLAKQQFKIKITPAPKPANFNNSSLEFLSYEDGIFTFDFDEKFKLSKQTSDHKKHALSNNEHGQFIGLIIDNKPPITLYENNYKKPLRNGGHRIFAYLGTSYNEGIKTKGAFLSKKINVKNNNLLKEYEFKMPELYCTSPSGKYSDNETKKILLDFYLLNAKIDKDHKILLTINGKQTFTITKPRAYYLEGLPYGSNTIELLLVDKANEKISMPSNPISRMFTLEKPKEKLSEEETQKLINDLDK